MANLNRAHEGKPTSEQPHTSKTIPGGLFIVHEGGEGAGKTTRGLLLRDRLIADGYHSIFTHEPGATELGKQLRHILLDPTLDPDGIVGFESLALFAADRHAHLRQVVRPALAAGAIVICDRYTMSTTVYQTLGGVDSSIIETVNQLSTGGLEPARTYWFDVTPEVGLERIALAKRTERTKYDIAAIDFHRQIRAGFARLYAQHPGRITRIDAGLPDAAVLEAVYSDLARLIAEQHAT